MHVPCQLVWCRWSGQWGETGRREECWQDCCSRKHCGVCLSSSRVQQCYYSLQRCITSSLATAFCDLFLLTMFGIWSCLPCDVLPSFFSKTDRVECITLLQMQTWTQQQTSLLLANMSAFATSIKSSVSVMECKWCLLDPLSVVEQVLWTKLSEYFNIWFTCNAGLFLLPTSLLLYFCDS